ncbi:MAG: hypothetical protein D6784_11760 [Chloroflexi bacterium]|nr:MAG: hypothetical protein D6784_11760 [Chloroflexota bacterium]
MKRMQKVLFWRRRVLAVGASLAALALVLAGCGRSGLRTTAIPAERPASFIIETATPTPDPTEQARQAEQAQESAMVILPLVDAPTPTPAPAGAGRQPTAAALSTSEDPTATLTPTVTATPVLTATATATPLPPVTPDPPRKGKDWDFETDFVPWGNPYGEPCPGAAVASGWTAFVEQGQFGSSCFNENLYAPNVFSGAKSQEITFDFIAANSGILRTIEVKPGHRYRITAYAKHDRSLAPVQMFLGVDLTGGTDWQADTVQWFPWDNAAEDTWVQTEETVTATGKSMTIFIRGYHPTAEQGGKTVIDNVQVEDLGR